MAVDGGWTLVVSLELSLLGLRLPLTVDVASDSGDLFEACVLKSASLEWTRFELVGRGDKILKFIIVDHPFLLVVTCSLSVG